MCDKCIFNDDCSIDYLLDDQCLWFFDSDKYTIKNNYIVEKDEVY